jgi:hypothetical protein
LSRPLGPSQDFPDLYRVGNMTLVETPLAVPMKPSGLFAVGLVCYKLRLADQIAFAVPFFQNA